MSWSRIKTRTFSGSSLYIYFIPRAVHESEHLHMKTAIDEHNNSVLLRLHNDLPPPTGHRQAITTHQIHSGHASTKRHVARFRDPPWHLARLISGTRPYRERKLYQGRVERGSRRTSSDAASTAERLPPGKLFTQIEEDVATRNMTQSHEFENRFLSRDIRRRTPHGDSTASTRLFPRPSTGCLHLLFIYFNFEWKEDMR